MRRSNKDGLVGVFTLIAFALVGSMLAYGLYDAARIGLLTPDWMTQVVSFPEIDWNQIGQ